MDIIIEKRVGKESNMNRLGRLMWSETILVTKGGNVLAENSCRQQDTSSVKGLNENKMGSVMCFFANQER